MNNLHKHPLPSHTQVKLLLQLREFTGNPSLASCDFCQKMLFPASKRGWPLGSPKYARASARMSSAKSTTSSPRQLPLALAFRKAIPSKGCGLRQLGCSSLFMRHGAALSAQFPEFLESKNQNILHRHLALVRDLLLTSSSYQAMVVDRPSRSGIFARHPNSASAREVSRQRRGCPSGLLASQRTAPS
jgi:hypothetical protein